VTTLGQQQALEMKQTCPVEQDAVSFLAFYQRQRPALTTAFRRMTDDTRYVDDAIQEALLIARHKWPQVSTYDKPEAWVAKVALRLMRRWQHRDHQRLQHIGETQPPDPPDRHESHQHDDLYTAVAALPPRQRQVIVLHYLLDFTIEDVAEVLGRATGTVKAQLHTAREKLKASLGEGGPA